MQIKIRSNVNVRQIRNCTPYYKMEFLVYLIKLFASYLVYFIWYIWNKGLLTFFFQRIKVIYLKKIDFDFFLIKKLTQNNRKAKIFIKIIFIFCIFFISSKQKSKIFKYFQKLFQTENSEMIVSSIAVVLKSVSLTVFQMDMGKIGNEHGLHAVLYGLVCTQMHVPMANYGHKNDNNYNNDHHQCKQNSTLEILYTIIRKVFWRFIN